MRALRSHGDPPQFSHAFSMKLAACEVTVAEWVVMREIYESETVVPSELADRLGMTRAAISKLADRLTAKSLVVRTSNAADRRYQALGLPREGQRLVPRLSALADQNDSEFLDTLHRPSARSSRRRIARSCTAWGSDPCRCNDLFNISDG